MEALDVGVILFDDGESILKVSDRAQRLWPAALGQTSLEGLKIPHGLGATPVAVSGGFWIRRVELPGIGGALLLQEPKAREFVLRRCLNFYNSLLHDLRNPMAGIRMLAQAFDLEMGQKNRRASTEELYQTYIPKIVSEVGRMARCLDFTRYITPSNLPLGKAFPRLQCDALIEDLLKRESAAFLRLGWTLDYEGGGSLYVATDRARLIQALRDLLGVVLMGPNTEGGVIQISVHFDQGQGLVFCVRAKTGGFFEARWDTVLGADGANPSEFTGVDLALLTTRHLAELGRGTLTMAHLSTGAIEGRLTYPKGVNSNGGASGGDPSKQRD